VKREEKKEAVYGEEEGKVERRKEERKSSPLKMKRGLTRFRIGEKGKKKKRFKDREGDEGMRLIKSCRERVLICEKEKRIPGKGLWRFRAGEGRKISSWPKA